MAPYAVLDSDVIIGKFDTNDSNHEIAEPIFDGITNGELPNVYITEYVFLEVVNYFTEIWSHSPATELKNRLLRAESIRIVTVTNDEFEVAKDERYDVLPGLSLTDTITVLFMENEDIEYLYSLDDDFDQAVNRLNRKTNPYDPR